MKTPENTKNDPDDPEPANGYIQMEYSTDYLISPITGAVTKNYLKRTHVSLCTT
jgi:hypothetical protein